MPSPVVIPLLSEGYLDAELHFNIINLLETSDKQINKNCGGPVRLGDVAGSPALRLDSLRSEKQI